MELEISGLKRKLDGTRILENEISMLKTIVHSKDTELKSKLDIDDP